MGSRWFPRTLATWKEPKAFVRLRTAKHIRDWPWRGWFLFLGLISLAVMVPLCLGPDGVRLPPPAETLKHLVGILVMAAVPHLLRLTSSRIWIQEDGIYVGSSRWSYEQLFRVVPSTREIDGRSYTVLRLEDLHGRSIEVAVDDTIGLSEIEDILRAQGVRVGD